MIYENAQNIGARVHMLRKKNKISIAELSAASHIPCSNISYLEHGKYNPSFEKLEALSKALDCSLEWLLTGREDYEKDFKKILKLFNDLSPQDKTDLLLLLQCQISSFKSFP